MMKTTDKMKKLIKESSTCGILTTIFVEIAILVVIILYMWLTDWHWIDNKSFYSTQEHFFNPNLFSCSLVRSFINSFSSQWQQSFIFLLFSSNHIKFNHERYLFLHSIRKPKDYLWDWNEIQNELPPMIHFNWDSTLNKSISQPAQENSNQIISSLACLVYLSLELIKRICPARK